MLNYAPPIAYPTALVDTSERTANRTSTRSLRRLHESIVRSTDSSEYLTRIQAFDKLRGDLADLRFTELGWNSYGSPQPSAGSIQAAEAILNSLRIQGILPAKVLPSAEGGVAITFTSNSPNRAVIETLNDGETFLLLYNRSGDSQTLDFPGELNSQNQTFADLKLHLRGTSLATS